MFSSCWLHLAAVFTPIRNCIKRFFIKLRISKLYTISCRYRSETYLCQPERNPMKTSFLFPILLALFLFSCSSPSTIYFGMFSKYEMRDGEINHHPIPQEKIDEFGECCYMDQQNIFLNRSFTFSREGYQVFIGAGETLHSSEFADVQEADTLYTVKEIKSFSGKHVQYDAYLVHRKPYYLSRVVFDEPKSGLLLVLDHAFTKEASARNHFDSLEVNLEKYIKVK
jgi:hypothetical protein